jgi:hypothetical protein
VQPAAPDQYSLDHLFVDGHGVPTLVEVKRSTNPEIRRRIVGQILDYAANGVRYWPVDRLRSRFDEACVARGEDPVDVIDSLRSTGTRRKSLVSPTSAPGAGLLSTRQFEATMISQRSVRAVCLRS